MPVEYCIHDDDPNTCPPCRRAAGRDKPLAVEPPVPEFTFYAKFDGTCKACNLPTYTGQEITKMTNGEYWHEDCAYA